ncbi:MAG: hypothetical protein AAFX65_02005 [Cyanobacteria bacterium J06638_7]
MTVISGRICYIHAGTHKTASTYIQSRLIQNRKILLGEGIIYEFPGRDGRKHKPLLKAINRSNWKAWHTYLERFQQRRQHLLMSAEQFTRPLCDTRHLARIAKILLKHDYQLHVVVFIRPQLEYINSRYVHTLRRLYHSLTLEEYVSQSMQNGSNDVFNYNQYFEPLLSSGIPFTFIPFSRRYGDPFLQLMSALQLSTDLSYKPAAPGSENVQPGTKGVWLSRLVVQTIEALGLKGRSLKQTSKMVRQVAEREGWHEQRYFGFSEELAERTINHYQAGNDAFSQRVWAVPWQQMFGSQVPTQSIYSPACLSEADRMNQLADQIVRALAKRNPKLANALNTLA